MARWRLARAKADLESAERCVRDRRWTQAQETGRKATAAFADLRGPGAAGTLRGRLAVAAALSGQHRWEEAAHELHLAVDAVDPAVHGTLFVVTLRSRLAQALRVTGRLEQAEAEARLALSYPDTPPGRHQVAARDTLALVLGDLGRHREAAELCAVTAAEHVRLAGAGSAAFALKARANRISLLAYVGQHDEVAAEAEAVRAAASALGEPAASQIRLAAALAWATSLSLQGRFQDAEALLRPELAEAGRGLDEEFAVMAQLNLARASGGLGKAEEAWQAVAAAQAVADRMHTVPTGIATALAYARASALLALDRVADADREVRRCLELCESHLSPVHHRTLEARTLLGIVLARRGDREEGAIRLQAALDVWLVHFGDHHHGTASARQALAGVFTGGPDTGFHYPGGARPASR
ncbi:tetratricopeptide repeat protein [Kitasatospora paracochleata]|uniref:Tetratricopeptide (TPR) repeat protein n=1 Tax=Kitasatospora paracochleata TaxID=58354 RepID=A0ABT1JB27_9ACTN|nr:tetratricopeptide repeat protein [Kitasatospora paracochleata]MCP2314266.1 tetratricopeptide (TPR) repeat protein [Kitasatospora paracochleata]